MPLALNQQLFEYRIERILGRGAFGTVYLAHDTLLDRPVAVKELTITAQTNEMAFKRFLQEARAAGGLDSPHIVTVHALKVVGPEVYLVTEYLAGGAHLVGVALVAEEDKAADPVDVGLFGADGIVFDSDGITDTLTSSAQRLSTSLIEQYLGAGLLVAVSTV